MSLKERIRGILDKFKKSKKYEKLPTTFILDTGIIPIICEGNSKDEFAIYIKEEIQQYPDFYRVFLSDYDGICIGDTYRSEFKNPLVLSRSERILVSKEIPNAEEIRRKKEKENAIYELEYCISSDFRDSDDSIKFEMMRKYYKFTGFRMRIEIDKKEKNFYRCIFWRYYSFNYIPPEYIHKPKNEDLEYLYITKDYEGLKEYFQHSESFVNQFVNNHPIEILNCAIDSFEIPDENCFFENNINLIYDAIILTENYLSDYEAEMLKFAAFQRLYIEENKDKPQRIEMLYGLYEADKYKKNSTNIEIDRFQMLALVNQILVAIDPSERLSEYFNQSLQEGRIIIYDFNYPEDVIKKCAKLGIPQDKAKEHLNNKPEFIGMLKGEVLVTFSKVPISYHIVDIPTIIHEFIHLYHFNNGKLTLYNRELASIFYETFTIYYLINNGYEKSAEVLKQKFLDRKINDSHINSAISELVKLKYKKKKKGTITEADILESASIMANECTKKLEDIASDKVNYICGRTVSISQKEIIDICSYAIGTYFSEKYLDNPEVQKHILELISNPNYTLQNLIGSLIGEDKQVTTSKGQIGD